MDAINALTDMRDDAPATVTLDKRGRSVEYATLLDERES